MFQRWLRRAARLALSVWSTIGLALSVRSTIGFTLIVGSPVGFLLLSVRFVAGIVVKGGRRSTGKRA